MLDRPASHEFLNSRPKHHFSMSNGWITTICFTNAPQRFAPFELELRETSEEMVFTGLTSGLITGSLMSFVVKAITVYA